MLAKAQKYIILVLLILFIHVAVADALGVSIDELVGRKNKYGKG